MPSRRIFLKTSAAAIAAPSLAPAVVGPDKLTICLMGCGGMGTNHLKLLAKHPQITIAHICDADSNRLAAEREGLPRPTLAIVSAPGCSPASSRSFCSVSAGTE